MNWYFIIDFFFLIRNLPLVDNKIKHKGKMMRHPQRTKENKNENKIERHTPKMKRKAKRKKNTNKEEQVESA